MKYDKYPFIVLFASNQLLNENFLNFPKRQLQSEAANEAQPEVYPDLSHEPAGDLPHGEVHTVGLGQEEEVVPGHVEEVGHEGDLGDGQPKLPGEKVIDDPSVAPAASEGDPEETEAPG